jgi:hypothetical protein
MLVFQRSGVLLYRRWSAGSVGSKGHSFVVGVHPGMTQTHTQRRIFLFYMTKYLPVRVLYKVFLI